MIYEAASQLDGQTVALISMILVLFTLVMVLYRKPVTSGEISTEMGEFEETDDDDEEDEWEEDPDAIITRAKVFEQAAQIVVLEVQMESLKNNINRRFEKSADAIEKLLTLQEKLNARLSRMEKALEIVERHENRKGPARVQIGDEEIEVRPVMLTEPPKCQNCDYPAVGKWDVAGSQLELCGSCGRFIDLKNRMPEGIELEPVDPEFEVKE